MKKTTAINILILLLLTTACLKKSDSLEAKPAPVNEFGINNDPNRCSYVEQDVYSLYGDTTADFDNRYVDIEATVLSSNCDGLYQGDKAYEEVEQIKRLGSKIAFNEDGSSVILTANGLSIESFTRNICINGVEIISVMSEGSINSSTDELTMKYSVSLHKNGCTTNSGDYLDSFSSNYDANSDRFLSFAENASTYMLYYYSETGDYIGGGKEKLYEEGEVSFNVSRINGKGVSISMNTLDGDWWTADFVAANNAPIAIGNYTDATRYPFQNADSHGFDFSGSGRGCNTLMADFEVLEVNYDTDGTILNFQANFTQHCEGKIPAIHGTIRYNATDSGPM